MDYSIGIRLREVRNGLNMKNQSHFSELLGIKQTTLSKYENGTSDIPDDIKTKIGSLGINLHWLLTGEGNMLINNTGKNIFEIPLLTKEQLLSFDPEEEIPQSERKANSGDYPDLAYIPVPMRVMEYSTDLRAAVAFDSRMAPVIRSGDIAIFEATGWNGSGIYLYRMGGGLHIGYVGHYGNTLHLFNEWKDVEQPYDSETFKPIGRVRAVVSDLLGKDWKGGKQPPE